MGVIRSLRIQVLGAHPPSTGEPALTMKTCPKKIPIFSPVKWIGNFTQVVTPQKPTQTAPNDGFTMGRGCIFGCFQKIVVPENGWFIVENPINKWMIWEYPYFWKYPFADP